MQKDRNLYLRRLVEKLKIVVKNLDQRNSPSFLSKENELEYGGKKFVCKLKFGEKNLYQEHNFPESDRKNFSIGKKMLIETMNEEVRVRFRR